MAALLASPGKPVAAILCASRRRPERLISTSSRAHRTSTSSFSTPIHGRSCASSCRTSVFTSIPANRAIEESGHLLHAADAGAAERGSARRCAGFMRRYEPGVTPRAHPKLRRAGRSPSTISKNSDCSRAKMPRAERGRGARPRDALSNLSAVATRGSPGCGLSRASRSSIRRRTASRASHSTGSTCCTRCCSARNQLLRRGLRLAEHRGADRRRAGRGVREVILPACGRVAGEGWRGGCEPHRFAPRRPGRD